MTDTVECDNTLCANYRDYETAQCIKTSIKLEIRNLCQSGRHSLVCCSFKPKERYGDVPKGDR